MRAVEPPATIGILGGGQLGRYFVIAARTMGYRTMVLEPDADAPAGKVADVHLVAAYDDPDALDALGAGCAVVTTEFENPPASALARLSVATAVHPSPRAIEIAQDRRLEKRFLADTGAPVGPFAVIESADHVTAAAGFTYPAVLKTARLGYDGKGQVGVADHAALAAAWEQLGRVACVLEQRLPLDGEVSVIIARSAAGETVVYPAAQNEHANGILDVTTVPASSSTGASELALAIADSLGYVGVLAVEMFVVEGRLLVNELAPRPHNSGHWTLDGCRTSQFEQQVRAVCGLPLGSVDLAAPSAAMVNLLGDCWAGGEPDWSAALAGGRAKLHLYGKTDARPGRKMGHLTVLGEEPAAVRAAALALRERATRPHSA